MLKTLPIYLISGFLGIIALYSGLSGKKVLFISDAKIAAITLAAVGFVMCSTGALAPFINKAPAHPLSISGYILGVVALLVALVQIFSLKIPIISEPKNALIIIAVIIIIKIVIARFGFIFK